MHEAARSYVADSVSRLGPYRSVVEIGSRDLNGSVRELFADASSYTGLDVVAGPGVDVVFDPAVGWKPDELVDVVVSCEVLEHVPAWSSVLVDAARYLKGGGSLIVTAAGTGRRPHSGITGRRALEPGEHYENVDPDELRAELENAGFVDVDVELVNNDVRARARRKARTVVAIPFLDEFDRTRQIASIAVEDPDVDLLILDDNGSTDPAVLEWLESFGRIGDLVRVNHRPPLGPDTSLYRVWNEALDAALELGEANLVLSNNDVRILPRTFGDLARALRRAGRSVAAVYPDYRRPLTASKDLKDGRLTPTSGTWRAAGLSGFCFAVKAELVQPAGPIPRFDTRYAWIYGDGDFVEGLEAAGYVAARVEGLPLEHDRSTTASRVDWIREAKAADTDRRNAKVAELDES